MAFLMPNPMFPFGMPNMNQRMPFLFPMPFGQNTAPAAGGETPAAEETTGGQQNASPWMGQMQQMADMLKNIFRVPDMSGTGMPQMPFMPQQMQDMFKNMNQRMPFPFPMPFGPNAAPAADAAGAGAENTAETAQKPFDPWAAQKQYMQKMQEMFKNMCPMAGMNQNARPGMLQMPFMPQQMQDMFKNMCPMAGGNRGGMFDMLRNTAAKPQQDTGAASKKMPQPWKMLDMIFDMYSKPRTPAEKPAEKPEEKPEETTAE